jgi:hypothetical protein
MGKGQNYENQSVKNENVKSQRFVNGSEHWKSPLKWSERQKIGATTTTYGVLPMDTKACGGLGYVKLG